MKSLSDRKYLDWLKRQLCVVCGRTPCDPAHVGLRGLGMKCSDREAIPLCPGHHRRDGWPDSHHRLGKRFFKHHGLNPVRIIAALNRRYEKEQFVKDTKTERCLELLRRPEGATLDELAAVLTTWKKSSVAGFVQNAKKKFKIELIKPKTYAIVSVAAPADAPVDGEAA